MTARTNTKPSLKAVVSSIRRHVQDFSDEWANKFNDLKTKIDRLVPAIATELAQLRAGSNVTNQCVDAIDLQQQATFKMMQEIYGRLETIDAIFERDDITLDNIDMDQVYEDAQDTYTAVAQESVDMARREREEAIKAREAEEAKAQAEAEEAAKKAAEPEVAEEALKTAESPSFEQESGGPGADIPEGAEVFGG